MGTFPAHTGLGRTCRGKRCPGYSGDMNSKRLFSSFRMRHTGILPGNPPDYHNCCSLGQCFAVPLCRVQRTGSVFSQGGAVQLGWGEVTAVGVPAQCSSPAPLQKHSPLFNSPTELHMELNSVCSISYPFPYKPLLRLYVTQLSPIQNYCI